MIEWLDRAVKKHGGHRGGYHSYLKAVWDDYMSGNMGHGDQFRDMQNPWG